MTNLDDNNNPQPTSWFTWAMIAVVIILLLVVMSTCAAAAERPQVRLCTGVENGVYDDAGKIIKRWAGQKLDVQLINTEGSIDNIEKAMGSECDAFIAQPDSLVQKAKDSPGIKQQIRSIGVLHREYVQVLCNKESGLDDLGDLEGTKHTLDIGAPGSGAWTTWQNFVAEDDGYSTVVVKSDGGELALAAVATGDTDCMLVTSGLHSGIMNMADANYSDTVAFVGANDKDFNDATTIDGKPLYSYIKIKDVYPNLQSGWFSSVSTLTWQAGVYVNTETMDRPTMSKFISIVSNAAGEIKGKYGK